MVLSTKTLMIVDSTSQDEVIVTFSGTNNLLELLNANKIGISQSCGGNGTCTTCRIFIAENSAAFSERSETEKERAEERDFQSHERLCCQTEISENARIIIP